MAEINKYNNSKIYRIVSNVTGENYYGSTTEPTLARRLAKHKCMYKLYIHSNSNKYYTSFKILETNDYEIVLVENVNCNSKSELHQRERYYIENNQCVNKVIPNRTTQEYYKDNQDKISEYQKQYQKQYYKDNEDKISEYQKEYKKQYYKDNQNKTSSHQSNLKQQSNEKKRISKQSFEFIFELDSIFRLPKSYTNIVITN